MKSIKYLSVFFLVMLVAGAAVAQTTVVPSRYVATCPHPFSHTYNAPPPSPPTLDPSDFTGTLGTAVAGSTWNQTKPDKGFGYSFHIPSPKNCCLMQSGWLKVTVKALVPGPTGTSTSANDWVQLVHHGQSVAGTGQQPFASGATLNQTKTVTINVPASILATGIVSFYVQDDSAVLSAELHVDGCCINAPSPNEQ